MAERITDAERRRRLVARHHLGRTAEDVVAVVRGVVALHSSDPITPYLASWARVAGFRVDDLDAALYEERTLWRLHAMRRTLFVVPSDEAATFVAAAGREVARGERRRVEQWLSGELDDDVAGWLTEVEARVMDALADGGPRATSELTTVVPELGTEITLGSGKWSTRSRLASRLLYVMAMEGRIVRTRPAGSWRSSQYRWASVATWLGDLPAAPEPEPARAELTRRYLAAYGPVTATDVRWWTGWSAKHASAALRAVDAVPVGLEGGGEGFVLPEDLAATAAHGPRAALLPGLDPTPMGWKERHWYLGAHAGQLYDRNGNAGRTVWVDGRVVGGWAQRPDGEVVHRLLEDVGAEAARAVEERAAELTTWLAGRVAPRFRTPFERELST